MITKFSVCLIVFLGCNAATHNDVWEHNPCNKPLSEEPTLKFSGKQDTELQLTEKQKNNIKAIDTSTTSTGPGAFRHDYPYANDTIASDDLVLGEKQLLICMKKKY
jgi:hypothetical protein